MPVVPESNGSNKFATFFFTQTLVVAEQDFGHASELGMFKQVNLSLHVSYYKPGFTFFFKCAQDEQMLSQPASKIVTHCNS